MEMNLSKLHKVISRLNNEIRERQQGVSLLAHVSFTPKTEEGKIYECEQNLAISKKSVLDFVDGKIGLLPYLAELKTLLHRKNNEVGIDALMIEASNCIKELELLRSLLTHFEDAYGMQNEKMSFAEIVSMLDVEKNPCVQRTMTMVTDVDIANIRMRIKSVEEKREGIEDKIAYLNQTTIVNVPESPYGK